MYDVIIIGAGPAGLTSAIYTGRAKLKTLVLEANVPGGNAGITDLIENYPGFPGGISGAELMALFMKQAEEFGVEIVYDEVRGIQCKGEVKTVITTQNQYESRTIIVAAGARRRELGVEGERQYLGKGVSYCATCDGFFFRDKTVAVIGGGDSAVKEALYLAELADRVYLIHRREKFRANQTSLDKMLNSPKVELKLNKIVQRIEGDNNSVKRLILADVNTGEEETLPVNGVFVSIGMTPASDFITNLMEVSDGYILTDENMMTNIKGIFAAGDIRSKKLRQISTAVGDGALAGAAVSEYIRE
jgi:thioredoxin reductase (NADPH)